MAHDQSIIQAPSIFQNKQCAGCKGLSVFSWRPNQVLPVEVEPFSFLASGVVGGQDGARSVVRVLRFFSRQSSRRNATSQSGDTFLMGPGVIVAPGWGPRNGSAAREESASSPRPWRQRWD